MLAGAAALTGAATVGLCLGATCTPSPTGADAEPGGGGGASDSEPLRFGVNGEWHVIRVSDAALKSIGVNTTLIEYLRETCRLTGTKLGCGVGGCGVCTVMLSRRSPGGLEHRHVNSCLLPLFSLHGAHVTTVEGIGSPRDPHPVQTQVAEFHGTPHHSVCSRGDLFTTARTATVSASEAPVARAVRKRRLAVRLLHARHGHEPLHAARATRWSCERSRAAREVPRWQPLPLHRWLRTTPFSSHFILQTIVLPRQAREKTYEN